MQRNTKARVGCHHAIDAHRKHMFGLEALIHADNLTGPRLPKRIDTHQEQPFADIIDGPTRLLKELDGVQRGRDNVKKKKKKLLCEGRRWREGANLGLF